MGAKVWYAAPPRAEVPSMRSGPRARLRKDIGRAKRVLWPPRRENGGDILKRVAPGGGSYDDDMVRA